MAATSKRPLSTEGRGPRRIWGAPTTNARKYWLLASLVLYLVLSIWYYYTLKTQPYPGPLYDPLRLFGIFTFTLVLVTASYTLRRRFVRSLPGRVQEWLWMHTWIGVLTILVALLHENYTFITHDYCQNLSCLTDTYWAGSALLSLILLVVSGVAGRFLDMWQTRIIAYEANTNGVGIAQALMPKITELEYTLERLAAGKSVEFKQYCAQLSQYKYPLKHYELTSSMLLESERADLRHAHEVLNQRGRLVQSLARQQKARQVMRIWRTLHTVLASTALIVISYHATMELLTNVLHIITPA